MIKNIPFRINIDQRGHISCGAKRANGAPMGLDHWDISPFPELVAIYGDKPQRLVIYLPANDLLSVFDCEYSEWGKGPKGPYKKRVCDGDVCTHRVDETFLGEQFCAGEESECLCSKLAVNQERPCKYSAHLKVMIGHPETRKLVSPVVYAVRTHSAHSGAAVWSELVKMEFLTQQMFGEPKLTGIPFELSVAMVSSQKKAGNKFPIWRFSAITFDMPMLAAGERADRERLALPGSTESAEELADILEDEDQEEEQPAAEPPPARPWLPEVLRARAAAGVNRRIEQNADEARPAYDANRMVHTKLQSCMSNLGLTDSQRHDLIEFLFEAKSSKQLSIAECEIFCAWVNAQKTETGWVADERAVKECELVFAHLRALIDAELDKPFPDGYDARGNRVAEPFNTQSAEVS